MAVSFAYPRRVSEARHVAVIAYPAAELLDIACVVTTFQAANVVAGETRYKVALLSPGAKPITTAGV